MTMWDRLRHGWAKKGLTQKQVEAALGLSENRIAKLANGSAVLRVDEFVRLVESAGIRPWWLFDESAPLEEPTSDLSESELAVVELMRQLRMPGREAIRRLMADDAVPAPNAGDAAPAPGRVARDVQVGPAPPARPKGRKSG